MSYAVITFEDDGKLCAVPTSWFIGGKVHLPPLTGRNLRGAIKQAIPKQDTWEGYSASLVVPAETYELASAIVQKLSTQDEESDTSPCRGIPQRRRPEQNAALVGWCPMTSQDTYPGKNSPTSCLSEIQVYGQLLLKH
ncbi:unnamed protein product [Calicophoron daubneyi]|uniref:Uncharacterized protein n=1 Tax=Calicophoron daubneyi TaxID=300641 RepID=A0AAV2T3M4_CALDB